MVRITSKLAVILSTILILTASLYAQEDGYKASSTNKYMYNNLEAAIKSDNPGVRRSAIYMAGKYRIARATLPLINQLKKERDPETRILIALSLHKIGVSKGMSMVKTASEMDHSPRVRRMCAAIYNDYLLNVNKMLAGN